MFAENNDKQKDTDILKRARKGQGPRFISRIKCTRINCIIFYQKWIRIIEEDMENVEYYIFEIIF